MDEVVQKGEMSLWVCGLDEQPAKKQATSSCLRLGRSTLPQVEGAAAGHGHQGSLLPQEKLHSLENGIFFFLNFKRFKIGRQVLSSLCSMVVYLRKQPREVK